MTLAALPTKKFDVEYREIADLNDESDFPHYDLVAISSFSAQIYEAYKLADHYLGRNIPFVMGGLHVSSLPDEAKSHCTSVVIGEGEILWPRVLSDFDKGSLQPYYYPSIDDSFDLKDAPLPRFDLLDIDNYNRITVQPAEDVHGDVNSVPVQSFLLPGIR